jgi:hypothetical protein
MFGLRPHPESQEQRPGLSARPYTCRWGSRKSKAVSSPPAAFVLLGSPRGRRRTATPAAVRPQTLWPCLKGRLKTTRAEKQIVERLAQDRGRR